MKYLTGLGICEIGQQAEAMLLLERSVLLKVSSMVAAETAASLAGPCPMVRRLSSTTVSWLSETRHKVTSKEARKKLELRMEAEKYK